MFTIRLVVLVVKIVTPPTHALSKDERSLGMIIARELPENLLDDLDNVEIIMRPF